MKLLTELGKTKLGSEKLINSTRARERPGVGRATLTPNSSAPRAQMKAITPGKEDTKLLAFKFNFQFTCVFD